MKDFWKKGFVLVALLHAAVQAAPIEVWCGLPPLTAMVKDIGGDRVQAHSFLTGLQDPCSYSPTPRAVARARTADLFITAGMPVEAVVADKLRAMNSELTVADASSGVKKGDDPHIWLSLPLLSKMAENIEQALRQIDPGGAALYQKNRQALQERLMQHHEVLKQKLKPVQGVMFYVYHPVLGHFASDYGLAHRTVELHGKSPSPRQLVGLIDLARREQVRLVFTQPQFSKRSARILADRIGGQAVTLNPMAEDIAAVLEQAAEHITSVYETQRTQ